MDDHEFERFLEAMYSIVGALEAKKVPTQMGWPQCVRLTGWYALLAFTVYLIFLATS